MLLDWEDPHKCRSKMATAYQREYIVRNYNDPLYYSVTEKDTKPRSEIHAKRMGEVAKLRMARNTKLFAEKQQAIKAKEQRDIKVNAELKDRTLSRIAQLEKELKEQDEMRAKCDAEGTIYREPDSKYILVVRLKGTMKMAPKPRKVLALMRLRQINNAVFVQVNKSAMNMLKIVNPFVTFGEPTRKLVSDLVYKRGYCRTGVMGSRLRTRITSNDLIQEYLGKYGIMGMEDIIHEITTCGKHFREVNRFLHPFKLKPPNKGGFRYTKKHGFVEMRGGEYGNREKYITDLVERMV